MHTAVDKFLILLTKVQFYSDAYMLGHVKGKYVNEILPKKKEQLEKLKEENSRLVKFSLAISEKSMVREHFSPDFWAEPLPLYPITDFNLMPHNFSTFCLYTDALKEVTEELNIQSTLKEKKRYLYNLLKKINKHKGDFVSNDDSNVMHSHGPITRRLSKKFEHQNTWALLEVYKRYYEAFHDHIESQYRLINLSLENLKKVECKLDDRLIWIHKDANEDNDIDATEGRTFEKLHKLLKNKGLLSSSLSLSSFKEHFSIIRPNSYVKVTWLGTGQQLYHLIYELKKRKIIKPIGDMWMAAITTFKRKNGMDYNYKSLRGSTDISSEAKQKVDDVLAELIKKVQ